MRHQPNQRFHQGIRIDKIPAAGFAGLLFTIAAAATFLSLPEVRGFLLVVVVAAVPTAILLHYWHTQTRW
jgi:hypothetical protein